MANHVDATNPLLPTSERAQIDDKMTENSDTLLTPIDDNKSFESICLSGPIKILLPVDKIANEQQQQSDSRPDPVMTPMLADVDEPAVKDTDCDEEIASPLCPYIVGDKIFLKTTDSDARIEAEIVEYFPATLSCVMVIRFLDPPVYNGVSQCVLKLYDRRFSTQLRSDEGTVSWTPEIESLYQSFVASEDAAEFFSYWDAERATNPYWSGASVGTRDKWSQVKIEAYLQWESTSTYETEKKAYKLMAGLQGDVVPKVLGEVVLDIPVDAQNTADFDWIMSDDSEQNPHISSCPGLLLQHVEGFHLTDLITNQPREQWQATIDTAIISLNRIQDCGILNRDVNTRSFMVNSTTHNVMMLDFGLVFFKDQLKDDREWESSQAVQDEEGAVGLVMYSKLDEEAGGGYVYRPSKLALKLSYRYMFEDGEREGGTEEEEEYLKKHVGQPWDYDPGKE